MTNVSISLPGNPEFSVSRLDGRERLGEIGAFDIELRGPASSVVLPSRMLRSPCVIRLDEASGSRRVSGIVTRFVVNASDHEGERIYRMTVRPRLALLELRRMPRVVRDSTAPDIAVELARAAGYDRIDVRLSETYPALPWVIQYDETDATFLRRLCEEHGFWFRFEEQDGAEVLIFEDTSPHAQPAYAEPLALVARPNPSEARPFVTPIRRARRRAPGKVTLRDYDPDKPKLSLEAAATGGAGIEAGTEVYEAPGGFRSTNEGEKRARLRLESLRADAEGFSFSTNALALGPGRAVDLVESDRVFGRIRAAGTHLVVETRVFFEADAGRLVINGEAIPLSVPFRLPRVTPRPRIDGVQSAIVTGDAGEEIHTDGLGRVNIAFHWDLRGPKDAKSSIPVRVMQPEAPGAFVLPRVGWEVFVMFEDGDPERPVVLGRSYNAKQVPPLPLPANKTVTVLATDSSPGAGARTVIQMDDAAGREHILMSAPFGRDDKVFGDARVETRKNENAEVKADATHSIGGDETISVHLAWLAAYGSRSVTVAAMQKQTAGGSFFTELGGTESVTIGGVLGEKVGSPVKGAANLAFSAALSGIGSRGTAGAIVAAGLGIGRAAVEGYEKGGAKGAEHAAEMGLAGIAASMVPGGDAIMASVTGSAKPMPWDQGRPPEGVAAEGGGATAPSGASGAKGPGPGHRSTVIDGSYTEMVGGSYSILTPGAVSWVTVGPATLLVNGNHTTQAVKAGLQVAGAMNESLGALAIESATNVARKIKGVVTSDVAGARAMQAGGEYRMTAKSALKLSVGGSLGISGGTITFKCGASELVASGRGVTIRSVKVRITGSSSHSGKLTHE